MVYPVLREWQLKIHIIKDVRDKIVEASLY